MILILLGCEPGISTVQLSGVLEDAPFHLGQPYAGATLETRNRDGEVVGTDESDAAGAFALDVDAGASFYLNVRAEGRVPTAFSGVAGMQDFSAEVGLPWIAGPEWLQETTTTFAACPTLAEPGGVVTGTVVVNLGVGDINDWPAFPGVEVAVLGSDGSTLPGCYLDDDGVSGAELSATGGTGAFAVFGVPAGAINVTFTAVRSNGVEGTDVFEYIVEEDGAVPIYPAALEI